VLHDQIILHLGNKVNDGFGDVNQVMLGRLTTTFRAILSCKVTVVHMLMGAMDTQRQCMNCTVDTDYLVMFVADGNRTPTIALGMHNSWHVVLTTGVKIHWCTCQVSVFGIHRIK